MKYLIEATGRGENDEEYKDIEIKVEIIIDGKRENTSIMITPLRQTEWWIPVTELDQLMDIINRSTIANREKE